MILLMNRRYLVTVIPSGVAMCYIVIKTRKEQMVWQGFQRAGTCTLTLAPKEMVQVSQG